MWPLQTEVRSVWLRRRTLRLDLTAITFGDAAIRVALIDQVRAAREELRLRGIPIARKYRVVLSGGGDQLDLALVGAVAGQSPG